MAFSSLSRSAASPLQCCEIGVTVLLSVAVEFGNVGFTGEPVEVKYAGCGKVIATR